MKTRKGIILAGGKGMRLGPVTISLSKQLLPIYDKPMVYYPLSALMLTDIREYLLISTEEACPLYQKLLGDGSQFGIHIEYVIQKHPGGLPEAFILGEKFLNGAPSALILGDNLIFGYSLSRLLKQASHTKEGMHVFVYPVKNPELYGVVELTHDGKIKSLEEKPEHPKSNLALTGLYFCDGNAPHYAKTLAPSKRGELEIIDLMKCYHQKESLFVSHLGRGTAWLDTGSPDSLLDAGNFVATLERRQGLKIACLEEIALQKRWITKEMIARKITNTPHGYQDYLEKLILTQPEPLS